MHTHFKKAAVGRQNKFILLPSKVRPYFIFRIL